MKDGELIPKEFRLVKINNAFGGQVLHNGSPVDDYYLNDENNSGYVLRISIGSSDKTLDTSIFQQMLLTFEFTR
jgi:uncharacterized GH25 family protein